MLETFFQGFSIFFHLEFYIVSVVFFVIYIAVQYLNLFAIPHNSILNLFITPICILFQCLAEIFLIFYLAPLLLLDSEISWISFYSLVKSCPLIILVLLFWFEWAVNTRFPSYWSRVLLWLIYLSVAGFVIYDLRFPSLPSLDWSTTFTIILGAVVAYIFGLLLVTLLQRIIDFRPPAQGEYDPKALFLTVFPMRIMSFFPISIYGIWYSSQVI